MQHLTISGKFSTEFEAVENVLNEQVSKMNPTNGRFPVCVKTQISKQKISYGMQFWTKEMIATGWDLNFDNQKTILC